MHEGELKQGQEAVVRQRTGVYKLCKSCKNYRYTCEGQEGHTEAQLIVCGNGNKYKRKKK